ncbi:putative reverse transcriptase zinc-binding domain-containing protein [Helianthus anomalus]
MVALVLLNDKKDEWRWNSASDNSFSVKEVRKWLTKTDAQVEPVVFRWCNWIPGKCNVFMWRANLDRIPKASALLRRNITVGAGFCYFCGECKKTTEHLFTACIIAHGVWNAIAAWLKIPPVFIFSLKDVIQLPESANCSTDKKIMFGICIVTCWKIWATRNEVVFKQAKANVTKIVSDIKSFSFLWYNSRSKKDRITWKDWCMFDVT